MAHPVHSAYDTASGVAEGAGPTRPGPDLADDAGDAARRLHEHVARTDLPVLVLELPSGRPVQISPAMVALAGRSREEALATSAPEYTHDPEATRRSLALLADGSLDGYSRRVLMPRPGAGPIEVDVRVDACDGCGDERVAVVTAVPANRPARSASELDDVDGAPIPLLGTTTSTGVIDRIGLDRAGVLPAAAPEVLGRSLVDLVAPEDVGTVTELTRQASTRSAAVTGRVRLRAVAGVARQARIALQPLAGRDPADPAAGFAFALSDEPTSAVPAAGTQLGVPGYTATALRNRQLLSSAAAAARLAQPRQGPEHPLGASLTRREHDIVERLARGQRVRTIAAEMYLSQSTVRNHLTAVYRKFAVRSQVELLELLDRA